MTSQAYTPAFSRSDQSAVAKWFWTVDRGLLGAALALMAIGVSLSFASSPAAILAEAVKSRGAHELFDLEPVERLERRVRHASRAPPMAVVSSSDGSLVSWPM